jgi:acyl-CoA reductase-like NAD-dependent aldehyde dehydrogenase
VRSGADRGARAHERRGATAARLPVTKTYKLYLGGAFSRSESGRSYEADGANIARASRKDVRDAVAAAWAAFSAWARTGAMNRGQVLYRVAEMLEGRRTQFAELAGGEDEVDEAVDASVWYAGCADKLAQVLGSANQVSGPYFNFTTPEPVGVVGIVAPEEPPLAGLVTRLAAAIVGGNAAVVVASERRPRAALTLAEVLATSDVPAGVVNILTGRKRELCPVLAYHLNVHALDLAGLDGDAVELERLAAENVKRVVRSDGGKSPWHAAAFLELKTVWHPVGV